MPRLKKDTTWTPGIAYYFMGYHDARHGRPDRSAAVPERWEASYLDGRAEGAVFYRRRPRRASRQSTPPSNDQGGRPQARLKLTASGAN